MELQDKPLTDVTEQRARRSKHIYAIGAVEAAEAMNRLQALLNNAWKRTKWKDTPTTDALWRGICALGERYQADLTQAIERGQLLMCFPGSKVTALLYPRDEQ
jgi:hypothetical protein